MSDSQETLLSVVLNGQYGDKGVQRQLLSASAKHYWALDRRFLLYGGLSMDTLTRPALSDLLTLGGDNGLRGYPQRYQTGERRAVLTLEARAFSDLYVFNLFRIGAAAFYDVGSAWGGPASEHAHAQWLQNVGVGLRIFSVRSAFGNVLHADIAKPINADQGIKSLQFLLKAKTGF